MALRRTRFVWAMRYLRPWNTISEGILSAIDVAPEASVVLVIQAHTGSERQDVNSGLQGRGDYGADTIRCWEKENGVFK